MKNEKYHHKKKYGQNFLNNEGILEKISSNKLNNELKCVEVGAGLGNLTKFLVQELQVISFEIDIDLKENLLEKFKEELENNKVEFIFQDILNIWTKPNLLNEKYQLIANLPYNASKKIILKALQDNNCSYILVMIQKEVALKFSAKSNNRNFCSLSVISQLICKNVEILFDVPAEMFTPTPNVMSSVIRFEKRKEPINLSKDFLDFLKIAFASPRKKLISNISKSKIYDKNKIENIFHTLKLDNNIRAHQLNASQYEEIYNNII